MVRISDAVTKGWPKQYGAYIYLYFKYAYTKYIYQNCHWCVLMSRCVAISHGLWCELVTRWLRGGQNNMELRSSVVAPPEVTPSVRISIQSSSSYPGGSHSCKRCCRYNWVLCAMQRLHKCSSGNRHFSRLGSQSSGCQQLDSRFAQWVYSCFLTAGST
jgi:hypothetical protein